MNKAFLDYYQSNLEYLRKLGAEFAQDFPKIASRLEISNTDTQDPYVERLLEGTAFLAARVEKKFDDGSPRLLESILASAAPQVLAPQPSYTVLELQNMDASALAHDSVMPAGTRFSAAIPGVSTPCIFSTMWDIALYDMSLTSIRYLTLELGNFSLSADAGLHLSFSFNPANLPVESDGDLLLFLNLPDSEASELQRQLQVDCCCVYSKESDQFVEEKDVRFLIPELDREAPGAVKQQGQLRGIQLFHRFMAFQPGFRFLCIKGFAKLIKKARNGKLELLAALKRRNAKFVHLLTPNSLKLNCVPAVNLFTKRSDRCSMDLRHEFQVLPERTAPLDYEVVHVRGVDFFSRTNQKLLEVRNLYDDHETFGRETERESFAVHRRERIISGEKQQRSSYAGSEVFLSFSGDVIRKLVHTELQFAADLICSNRDLPILIQSGTPLTAQDGQPVKTASFAVLPSRPTAPLIANGGHESWEKISYLTMNFSSLFWQSGIMPLKMLRELIRLYSPRSVEEMEKLQQGIAELKSEPEVFRFIRRGSVFFENGWGVHLVLDELCFPGTGTYLFALALRELIRSYSPINTPVRIELATKQQGVITEWTI